MYIYAFKYACSACGHVIYGYNVYLFDIHLHMRYQIGRQQLIEK